MSKISTYSLADTPLSLSDRLIGTEAFRTTPTPTPLATKNFSLGELLQLFSANFPAASLQAVLNTGNTATQNINLTGTIDVTLIRPDNIEDTSGSQGTVFQYLSKGASSINWVDLPIDTLQAVLNAGNTATQNITLVGDITTTKIIPGNIQDDTAGIGTTGQFLSKTASGIRWVNSPAATTPTLGDVVSVGNTANQDIFINGLTIGKGSGTGATNTALGSSALLLSTTGYFNVATGAFTLTNNTTGNRNTALGYGALYQNLTGNLNVAIGSYASLNSQTGLANVALGYATLNANLIGSFNTGLGYRALFSNLADKNTAVGTEVMFSNTTGTFNTVVGQEALRTNLAGSFNSIVGNFALLNAEASYVSALGRDAGRFSFAGNLTTASESIFVGYNSKSLNTSSVNEIVIGANAVGLGNNTIVLGSDSIVTTALTGNVGIGTKAPSQKLHVSGDLRVTGAIYDSTNSPGTAGQFLASTVTGTDWVDSSAVSGTIPHATATGTDTYVATIAGVTAYGDGEAYLIRFPNGNTTGCTLNINALGAVPLYRNNDGALIGGDIWDGGEMLCTYNSTLNIFQCIGTSPNSLFSYITNADSVAITRGQPVYAFGGTGDRLTVKRAFNTSDAGSARTIGVVVTSSIAVNQKGIIIIEGLLDGLNILPTATWSDGDTVYLGTTAGSITNIKQYAPNHLVYLGTVTTASNGSAGRWYVKVQNGYELDELHNVQAQTPALKDTLWYDNTVTPGQWKTASIPTILGYTPFNLPSLTSGSVLFSNGTTIAQDNAQFFWDDTNNRLGIGTTAPGSKLEVFGTGKAVIIGDGTGASDTYIDLAGNRSQIGFESATGLRIQGTSTRPIVFGIGAWGTGEVARISTTGNVGIGTSAPTARLHVAAQGALSTDIALKVRNSANTADLLSIAGNGNSVINGSLRIVSLPSVGNVIRPDEVGVAFQFGNGNNTSYGEFRFKDAGGTDLARLSSTGNLGIGTTAPAARLDVRAPGALSTDIALRVRNSADTADLMTVNGLGNLDISGSYKIGGIDRLSTISSYTQIGDQSGTTAILLGGTGDPTNYYRNTTHIFGNRGGSIESMRITSAGSVLINNTASYYGYQSQVRGAFYSYSTADDRGIVIFPNQGTPNIQGLIPSSGNANNIALQGSGGNVGIGTTAPVVKLAVAGTTTDTLRIGQTENLTGNKYMVLGMNIASQYAQIEATRYGEAYLPVVINPSGGNVGIGTTAPVARLHVAAQGALSTDIAMRVRNSANTADLFNVNGNGNVGIGITTPADKLEVSGSGNVAIRVRTSTNTGSDYAALRYVQDATEVAVTYTNLGNYITSLGGTERMRILANGNVGIGTSSPTFTLDVTGSAGATARFRGAGQSTISLNDGTNENYLVGISGAIRLVPSGSIALTALGNGNVGIGTTNPAYKLDIVGFANSTSGFRVTDGTIDNRISWSSGNVGFFGTVSNHPIAFNTNLSERMRINAAGNVGIGTTAPVGRLDVRAPGALSIDTAFRVRNSADSNNLMIINGAGGIGVGTTSPLPSAVLDINSTTQGFLPPRMTNAQRTAISLPAIGLMVYCTDTTEGLYIYKSTGWTFII